jgi:tRNA(Ile)-lysidine synthase
MKDCTSESGNQPVKVQLPLLSKVEQFLGSLDLDCKPLVVAVSGGPDSVALLHALATLRLTKSTGAGSLVIAHLNHQLRGLESDGDERFVHELHDALRTRGLPRLELRSERVDVGTQARLERNNLESVGRRIRYDWLAEVARSLHARFVATGHTADDQAETVLHRLLRGTGLRGLRGIVARRRLAPGIELIRPLLGVTRAEVLGYLESQGQTYREDASNSNRNYMRNRIRHELLPYLKQHYNPAIASILRRLAEQADPAYEDHKAKASQLLAEAERPKASTLLVFAAQRLAGEPRHHVREVFRLVWIREGWPLGGMGFREWDRLAAVAVGEMPSVDLPGGIRARRYQHVVQIGHISSNSDSAPV